MCRTDNFVTFICRMSVNSGNLILLDPSGTVQTCTRIVLTLTFRSEEYWENELKNVKAICNDINTNYGLEKCAKNIFKEGKIQRKSYIGNTLENAVEELNTRRVCSVLKNRRQSGHIT